ncbi:MAG: NAD(P)/FAD-dependent oxidoreductase [Oscillospiraceae bacterium]|jgi:2,4-dienoyl-CoA reductase-like NADH-dependent reductase (Old Yellow Enzyme family)/thioredoxin reductase|nr:NAD(P)/FAD-dependent oxidoreductase [Oscillospiraceae bacterium]
MIKYKHLFDPIKIGDVVFRNRIFGSPTGHMDFNADCTPTDDCIAYYERKALGGAATVCVGECHINPPVSRMGNISIDLTNDIIMRFMYKLADRIQRLGAVPSVELQHAGRYANAHLGPSAGLVDGDEAVPCFEMTEEQIYETIRMYADAAAKAKYYGFGMVTVHGGHGWLPQQFFSTTTNTRTDKWGGSVENRGRFAAAVCDAIHEKCGRGFPVEFRISATEFEDGYGIEGGIEYAKCLDGHADIIHCSVGIHGTTKSENSLRWAPSMFDPDGTFVKYAAEIKKHVKHSLVSTVGALADPAMMEEIIASGKADIINVARGLVCDPDLPNKARAGLDSEIRKCIRCYGCNDSMFPTFRLLCALNPETGRENEFARYAPPASKQKVLVVGGGVGGMQAAISCAKFGHEVVLCEKSARLGGVILCEEGVPFKKHLAEYIETQRNALIKLGVEVRLNCEVTPEYIERLSPDAVIASLGSTPYTPAIEGADGENVFRVEEVFTNPSIVGQRVVIIGAGLSGTELALHLHALGKQVEVIELTDSIQAPMAQGHTVRLQLRDAGIKVRFNTEAKLISREGVKIAGADGEALLEADSVVFATGVKPRTQEAFALSAVSPVYHMIGDCAGGKAIRQATESAQTVAVTIGRNG